MTGVNEGGMLEPDQLNDMDEWVLDFLSEHEWATPGLMRVFYMDEHGEITRQWMSARIRRLAEHGHLEQAHPEHPTYQLVDDPRAEA